MTLILASACGLFVSLAGCGSSVTYTCKDNICTASEPAAKVELSAAAYAAVANTGPGPVTLLVTRSGGGKGAVSVRYATSDGTGVAGVDYVASAGTIRWAAGDRTPKTVLVLLKSQQMRRSSRSFALDLSAPSEGASLGDRKSAVVTVDGDE